MQAVKSTGSQIETILGKALWQEGFRYRKNDKSVFGKPDFTLKKYKIAVFADSEFWHGKDWEVRKNEHKSNIEFWHKKIERNIERDREVNEKLKQDGWIVVRFWGKNIKKNLAECVEEVITAVNSRRHKS
jgi:DNA mismatch endonuclease Vsr